MTLEDNPYEVGLGWQVDLEQSADFIGKTTLARIAELGAARKQVGIEIEGDPLDLNMTRWPVLRDLSAVGNVTSTVYSPRLDRNVGYANAPLESAALGTALTVETPLGRASATVVKKPFVDPTKEIPKS